MLPSFRLIAATFFCGFLMVFAGLRLAASLNDIHEGLPVMAAHAAPVSITPVADQDLRRALTAVPVMYDLRFAISRPNPTPVSVDNAITDRVAPLALPVIILPPESATQNSVAPEQAIAAINPEAPVGPPPPTVQPAIDVPVEAAKIETPQIETPKIEAPEVAAIAPAAEVPAPETKAPDPTPAVKAAAIDPQTTPELEAAEPLAPEPDSTASVDAPAKAAEPDAIPPKAAVAARQRKPLAAKPAAAKRKAIAKAKVVRKKRVRTARTAPAANPFGATAGPFGNP